LRTRIFAERVLWHAGLERRCARVRAIDLPVLDCEDSPAAVLEPLLEQGRLAIARIMPRPSFSAAPAWRRWWDRPAPGSGFR